MNNTMKNKKKYFILFSGFLLGILFYLFNVVVSNSEVSSIDHEPQELVRNIDYFIFFIYGIMGIGASFLILFLIRLFSKR